MASHHERKRESVKPEFAASRTTRTPDRDSHDKKEKRPKTAADNTRTSVRKQELNTKEDSKGLKTFCEERNYKEECQQHSNIEPQDAEENVLKRDSHDEKEKRPKTAADNTRISVRKQEHNSKPEMKGLENYCTDLKEKDAKELQQPHSSVDPQDVVENVLKRKQEHNSKPEMKGLENYCKDLKEKDAKELQQPHSSDYPQDVDENVLQRNILLEDSNAEVKTYEEETERLTQENTQLRMSINSLIEEKDCLIEEKDCLIEERKRLTEDKQSLIEEAKREREQSTKELENVRRDLTKSHKKERAQLLKNIDRLNVEKDNLLKRLSTIASDRLTHENPNIADLSDENRPTMLQEVYGELYDNEWTDAFEELKTHMNISDKDAIVILLKLIMNSFHNCREITWSRYEKLVNAASSIYIEKKTPIPCTEKKRSEEEAKSTNAYNDGNTDEKKEDNIETEGAANGETVCKLKTSAHDTKKPAEANMTTTSTASVNSCNEKNRDEKMESRTEKIDMTSAKSVQSSKDKAKCTIELNVGILHSIKDIWKTTSFELKGISAESIYSVVTTNMDIPLESMPNTSKYMKSCIDLCWRMSVQERPLHLEAMDEIDVKAGKKFDKDKFRHFTKSGENIDFVVWPALYRYEGGPLILKGIAQGC